MCNHHLHIMFQNIFITSKESSVLIKQLVPIPHHRQSLENNLCSVSIYLTILDISLHGIIQYMAFLVWLLSFSIATLWHVSFLLRNTMLLAMCMFMTLYHTQNFFSIVAETLYILTSNFWGLQFLFLPKNHFYFLSSF